MGNRQTAAIVAAMINAEIQKAGVIGDEQIERYASLALKLLRTIQTFVS